MNTYPTIQVLHCFKWMSWSTFGLMLSQEFILWLIACFYSSLMERPLHSLLLTKSLYSNEHRIFGYTCFVWDVYPHCMNWIQDLWNVFFLSLIFEGDICSFSLKKFLASDDVIVLLSFFLKIFLCVCCHHVQVKR